MAAPDPNNAFWRLLEHACFGAVFTSVDSGAAEACGGGDEGVARREW